MSADLTPWYRRPRRLLALLIGLALLAGAGWYGGREAWGHYHWRRARTAADHRDFPAALDHLAHCRTVWPEAGAVYLESARVARRAGRLGEADDFLHTAREREGSTPEVTRERLFLAAAGGQFPAVEEAIRAGLKPNAPDWLLAVEVLTKELIRTNRLREALAYLDEWIARYPDDVEGWLRRGYAKKQLLDLDGARADYEQVLARDPERFAVRLHLVQFLVEGKRVPEALPHLEVLCRSHPDDPAVRLCRARCEHLLGNIEEARTLLDALLSERPHDGQALSERGLLALGEDKVEEAERWLRQARDAAPHDRTINYNLLSCLKVLHKTEEEARVSEELKQIDADSRRMGELVQEVMRRPRDADLRCEAARIFFRNGLRDDGRRWLETALEADPHHRAAREALARYYDEEGKPDLAARQRQLLAAETAAPPESR
jgi:tetratricopeptide (TPR) repeat protein